MISIIIPAYNAEKTIKRCLDSIIRQTYRDLEIIVIDDGSQDGTVECVKRCMAEDSRIQLYMQENRGVSAARNAGMRQMKGDYAAFVDADDYLSDTMYEKMIAEFEENVKTDVVICSYYIKNGDKISQANIQADHIMDVEDAMVNLFIESSYCAYLWTKLFKSKIIKENNLLFLENINVCEDSVFCCQYFSKIRQVSYINEALYYYVENQNSASHNKYNLKRYSSIRACENIIQIIKPIQSPKLEDAVNAFYSVICVQLFILTFRVKSKDSKQRYKDIILKLKERKWSFLKSEWTLKYKLVFIVLKLCGCMIR